MSDKSDPSDDLGFRALQARNFRYDLPMLAWYGISSIVFGVVLFFPMRSLILAINVNRHQRKVQRPITAEERQALKKKVTIVAAILAVTFAFLYNRFLFAKFFGFLP